MVWSRNPERRPRKDHPARNSERGEEARKTEEEMGRQRKRMDRVGVYSITESG